MGKDNRPLRHRRSGLFSVCATVPCTQVLQLYKRLLLYYLLSKFDSGTREGFVQRPRLVGMATVAIAVLVMLLIASSCSASGGSISGSNASTALSTLTPVIAPQPNSNGAMARANVHGTGVYVTNGVRQLTGLKWKGCVSSSV